MKKRMLSLFLAVALLMSITCAVRAASHPFEDVPEGKWYSEHIQYVYEKGLMSGTGATTFQPEGTMTRAMTVAVLYRLAGSPETGSNNPFKDVPAGKWYTAPVIWAVENGITSGTSATTFAPDARVTREQLVTFLYRYAAFIDETLVAGADADLSQYKDANRISKFAVAPLGWAVTNGIISGVSATQISPAGSATRAQCATILSRFDRWLNNEGNGETDPSEPPADHEHKYHMNTMDASCTEGAYKLYWCELCGDQYKEYTSEPLGHNYVGTESEGRIDYVCTRCDDRYWESTIVIDDAFEEEVAKYVAQYINQFRNEEGAGTCEWLPGMAQVADYRADQLVTNFEHDGEDIREAHAHFQYGEYFDMTQYGYDESYNYWDSNAGEAISCGGSPNDYNAEIVGKHFAEVLRNSPPHWAYLVDDIYSYIAVGVKYIEGSLDNMGTWYVCVMINDRNFG